VKKYKIFYIVGKMKGDISVSERKKDELRNKEERKTLRKGGMQALF